MHAYFGRDAARQAVRDGAIKIANGFFVSEQPTPHQLAQLITQRWPGSALDAYSAARLHLGRKLEFPLHFLRASSMPASEFFHHRRVQPKGVHSIEGINVCNPLQAVEALTHDEAVWFLESLLAGRGAFQRVAKLKQDFPKLPTHTQRVLEKAIIGADSKVERMLTNALREYVEVRNNVKIGPYFWDLYLPKYGIVIDIDGYAYHNGEDRQTFEVDRHKLNDATQRKLRPLHYTATTILHHLDFAVTQVRRTAEGRRPTASPPWEWHWLWHDPLGG
ncbi:hypothetical protein [Corynebacterium sp.]|uniref:hypothetical protein n=1 Tax=Corynebacterium sp. TaxID=1720 RepID=UPI0026DD067A|nr:hypothetical protein [Corynebacterium sp.]MDO5032302.1 hypothetical protein [Corynebacterium sp.]